MTGMSAEQAVAAFARHRRDDDIVVSTMTAINWIGKFCPSQRNVSCVPLMGGASALGLGIAIAQPSTKVIVFDGDGSLLMQLGSLVSIAGQLPSNLVHIVMNNGVWFEGMANLPLPGNADFATIAKGAGFPNVDRFSSVDDWEAHVPDMLEKKALSFVELKIQPVRTGLWSPDSPQPDLPEIQFTRMGDELRQLASSIADENARQKGRQDRVPAWGA